VSAVVVLTVDHHRRQVVVSGQGVLDLAEMAGVAFRVTAAGSLVVSLDAIGDIEAAAAIRRRPVRIQSRRVATR